MAVGDGPLATAAVDVLADVDRFEPDLEQKTTRAVRNANRKIEREMRRSGERAGKEFGEGVTRGADGKLRDARGRFVSSGERAGTATGRGFSRGFQKSVDRLFTPAGIFRAMLKSVAGIGALVSSFTPITPAIGGVVAAVVALTGALVTASGAAIAAGVALSSLGLAGAAVAVGSRGLTDAFKAQTKALEELRTEGEISEATQQKLDAALKNLSPSARALVLEVGRLGPAWAAMRRVVQENLFRGAATQIRALTTTFLPVLRQQLGAAAATINRTAVALSQFLRSGEQSRRVATVLAGLNRILTLLLATVRPLTDAFLRIWEASLPQATRFAGVLAQLAERFAAFIERTTKSGQFQQFLETAMILAGQLMGILGNLAGILSTVFQAGNAEGANLLGLLNQLLSQFRAFLNSAQGQEALASFFGLIAAAGRLVQDVFAVLGPIISGVAAVFGQMAGPLAAFQAAMLPVAVLLGQIIGDALKQLAPLFGQLLRSITPLVAALGQGLAVVLAAVVQALIPVLPPLVQFIGMIVGQLTPHIPVLAAALAQIVMAFGQLLLALTPLLPSIAQVVGALLPLVPIIAQLIVAIAQVATVVIGTVVPALVQFQAGANTLMATVAAALVQVVQFAAGVVTAVLSIIPPVASFVASLVGGFVRIGGAVLSLGATIAGWVARVMGLIGSLAGYIVSAVTGAWQGALRATSGMLSAIVGVVTGLPGRILGALAGLAGVGAAIASPFQGAIGAVSSALSSVLGVIEGFVGKIQAAVAKISSVVSKIPKPNLPNINIPGFRQGAVLNRPTLGVFAEDGKEALIPLTKPKRAVDLIRSDSDFMRIALEAVGGAGAGGRSVTVHVPVTINAGNADADDVLAEAARVLEDAVRKAVA